MTQEVHLLPQQSNSQCNTFQSQKYFITPQPNLVFWWNLPTQHTLNSFSHFWVHSQQGLQTDVHPCNDYSKWEGGGKCPSCRDQFLLDIFPLMLPHTCWLMEDVLSVWILETDLSPPFFWTKFWSLHSQNLWDVCPSKMRIRISRHGPLSHRLLEKGIKKWQKNPVQCTLSC